MKAKREVRAPEGPIVEAIALEVIDYGRYPEYPQLHPPFVHGVTVLDLLFNVGPDAPWYIWGWREGLRVEH